MEINQNPLRIQGIIIDYDNSNLAKNVKTPQKVHHSTLSHTYEEAVTLAEVGKFHYFLLLVCGLNFMSVMVEIMCVSVILPTVKCDLTATLTEQGILASSGFLGVVLSSHAMGFLADTWGRIRTLRLALLMASVSSIISAFSLNIWMLIAFRILTGFFICAGQACVFSLCGEFHGNKTRVRHVTILSGFLPLSLIYLPATASLILPLRVDIMLWGLQFTSWRVLLLCNSTMTILAMLGLFALPETPKYVLLKGDHDAALEILRNIFVKNTRRPGSDYPVKRIIMQSNGASLANISGIKDAIKLIWNQTAPLFHRERWLHTLNICCMMFMVTAISQGIFMWLPTILNEMVARGDAKYRICEIMPNIETGTDLHADACNGLIDIFPLTIIMIVGAVFTAYFAVIAYSTNLISKKSIIFTLLVTGGISVTLIHWTTNFYVIVVLITLTMSVGNCSALISTISIEFFPTNINAMGMCFIMMVGRLGAFIGSNFLGTWLFNYCDHVFWGLLCACVSMIFMSMCLPERKYQKT